MIHFLADYLMFIIGAIALVALWFGIPAKNRFRTWCFVVMAGLTSLLLARILGLAFSDTARPFVESGAAAGASFMDNPGFPSDHMMLAMTLALAVIFATRWRWVGYVLLLLALLVGVGRVLALVHTPLDVAGGVLCALVGAAWYVKFARTEKAPIADVDKI